MSIRNERQGPPARGRGKPAFGHVLTPGLSLFFPQDVGFRSSNSRTPSRRRRRK